MSAIMIDQPIEKLLTVFKRKLWLKGVNAFYGRCFRHEVKGDKFTVKIQPLIYTSGNDYIEVLKDDTKDAQCFFDVLPNRTYLVGGMEINARIMFMLNLAVLYPGITRTEATQKAYNDAERLISHSPFRIQSFVDGYTGFSDYQWDRAEMADMHPDYLMRFDVKYWVSECII